MLSRLIHTAQDAASQTLRKTALGLAGGLFMLAGLGFLTAAAWLFLITVTTPLNAALILGGTYFGVGLIFLGFASAGGHTSRATVKSSTKSDQSEDMVPQLIAAFMTGLQAGQKARS